MSERQQSNLSENSAEFSDYEQLLREAKEELPQRDQPIEVEQGREIVERTRRSVEFVLSEAEELPIGPNTREEYQNMLREISTEPDRIWVFADRQARYTQALLWEGKTWMSASEGKPTVEVGQEMLQISQDWVSAAADRADLNMSPEQHKALGEGWLIWHELGHTLQSAYARKQSSDLSADAISKSVSEPYFKSEGYRQENLIAESERFAEGFGQMMVERYAVKELGISKEAAALLRKELTPDDRRQKMAAAERVIQEFGPTDSPDINHYDFAKALKDAGVARNNLGYGSPHSPEQVQKILLSTP